MNPILTFIAIVIVISVYSRYFGYDDTDDKANKKRSGMSLFIDHRTGFHYIKGGIFGNMIPRLDADGKQIRNTIKGKK